MRMDITPRDRLIVALDTPDASSARELVETLGDIISTYKVGIELFTAVGPEILKWLKKKEEYETMIDSTQDNNETKPSLLYSFWIKLTSFDFHSP